MTLLKIQLDHVALGMHTIADAEPFLEGVLGGTKSGGFDGGPPVGFMQWVFSGGGRIEVIYPIGAYGFLHRFLARGGPRVHHVTFKVSSLDGMLARAAAMSYRIASQDRSDPHWQEAFLHPKQAQGIVVQLAEVHPELEPDSESADFVRPPFPVTRVAPETVKVIGLLLSSRSEERALRQWQTLLGGELGRERDRLVFGWPESPLRIAVRVQPDAEEGPLALELSARRVLALPEGPHPALSLPLVQVEEI